MQNYLAAKAATNGATGSRAVALDPTWAQGRGVFGGLLSAMTVDAMRELVADDARILRSFTVHFCAPALPGPATIEAELVRAGSRLSHAAARVRLAASEEPGGGIVTMASASFCKARAEVPASYARVQMPSGPKAADLSPLPPGIPGIPTFLQHFDVRFGGPSVPFSGASVPEISAWIRLREAAPIDAAHLVMLLDVLPPAVAATFDGIRPVASADFSVQLFTSDPARDLAPDEHAFVSIVSRWADDGYAEELRELWSPRGTLLAQCRQLMVLL